MRAITLAVRLLLSGLPAAYAGQNAPVEPQVGTWKTWVISSGHDFRVPPPPGVATTAQELDQLTQLAAKRDQAALDVIAYWDTGSPSYRWSELMVTELLKNGAPWQLSARDLSLMHIAIYDAMIAAWDSAYAYNRPPPTAVKNDLTTVIPNPSYPSYPSAHAVAAGAASEVLAYVFPDRAEFFQDKAQQTAQSRVIAGVNYPAT